MIDLKQMETTMMSASTMSRAWRRRRRGLNLFGVLMALSLVAAAVIGTVTIYNSARETQARNDSQQLLTQLVVSVHQIYQGVSQYPAESLIDELDVRGAIPGSARTTSGGGVDGEGAAIPVTVGIENPFGGTVTVTGAGDRFEIEFTDLQTANCAALLDPYVGQTRGTGGLWQIDIGGAAGDGSLTENDVSTNCADDVDVTFHFE